MTSGTTQASMPVSAASPSAEELSAGIAALAGEISEAFAGDRWAILSSATDQVKWRLYDGAALRHCCQLLQEMDLAARSGQEFSVRLLQRAHIEAWLTGLYIHYGGFAAVTRVAQDTLHHLQAAGNEAATIDQWLAGERRTTRTRARKVQQANDGIRKWNEMNPDLPAKPLHAAPHIPQLRPTGLDLSDRIADLHGTQAQQLPVSELVDLLTRLAKEKGFGMHGQPGWAAPLTPPGRNNQGRRGRRGRVYSGPAGPGTGGRPLRRLARDVSESNRSRWVLYAGPGME